MRIRMRAAVLGLALPLVAAAAAQAEGPVSLRIAWTAVPGQLPAVLYQKTDILRHYGKTYTVDPVYYKGSGPQITALAAGELDIALYAPAALAITIQNAGVEDVRLIGDATRDGHDGYHTRQYMVRADSPIHSIEDLKGKVLATNSIGGALDMALRNLLRRHEMEDKKDLTIIEIDFPHMFAELSSGKIDLGAITTPFSFAAEQSGKVRTLFTMKEAAGGESDMTIMAARGRLIAAHRAALVDFFEDSQRAMRWFYDPANRAAVLDIIARFTKQPAAAYGDWLFTKKDDYRDPDLKPNVAAVQSEIDVETRLGFLKEKIDLAKYTDVSLVDEAAARPR